MDLSDILCPSHIYNYQTINIYIINIYKNAYLGK